MKKKRKTPFGCLTSTVETVREQRGNLGTHAAESSRFDHTAEKEANTNNFEEFEKSFDLRLSENQGSIDGVNIHVISLFCFLHPKMNVL